MHDKGVYNSGSAGDVITNRIFRNVFRLETEIFIDKRGTIRVLPIKPSEESSQTEKTCCAE